MSVIMSKETYDLITKLQKECLKHDIELWYTSDDKGSDILCIRYKLGDKTLTTTVKHIQDDITTYEDTIKYMEAFKNTVVQVASILKTINK